MWRVYMKKFFLPASEGVPFIKTGGLADVVGSLPKYIDKEYFDVRVFIPKYTCILHNRQTLKCPAAFCHLHHQHVLTFTVKVLVIFYCHERIIVPRTRHPSLYPHKHPSDK